MIRLPGLHQGPPGLVAPPGPSGHLLEDLEGPLRGSRVSGCEPDIGIKDTNQGHQRKIVTFRHELRANDNVELSLGNGRKLPAEPLRPTWKVAGKHDRP